MAEMSNYLENALLEATLRSTTFTAVGTPYVSLHTACLLYTSDAADE